MTRLATRLWSCGSWRLSIVLALTLFAFPAMADNEEFTYERFAWTSSEAESATGEAIQITNPDPGPEPDDPRVETYGRTPAGHRFVISTWQDMDVVQGDVWRFEDLESGFEATLEVLGDGPLPKGMGFEFWENHSPDELTWLVTFETSDGAYFARTFDLAVKVDRETFGDLKTTISSELGDEDWLNAVHLPASTLDEVKFLGVMLETMRSGNNLAGWDNLRTVLDSYIQLSASALPQGQRRGAADWVGAGVISTPTDTAAFLQEYEDEQAKPESKVSESSEVIEEPGGS